MKRRRHNIAIPALLAWALGAGAHAALHRWERAVVWMIALFGAFVCVRFSVWLVPVAIAIHLAGAIDAFVVAYRAREEPSVSALGVVVAAVVFVVAAVLLRAFVVEAFKIPSSAMYPTLQIGDHLFIRKTKSVERGELIVFKYPCDPANDYVKRVIAKAGDTIEVRCNVVYLNGKPLPAELVAAQTPYFDHDETNGQWFRRTVMTYRETLNGRSYELFRAPNPEAQLLADFPRPDEEPRCMRSSDGVRGKIVATNPDAQPCEPQLHYVVPADHVFVLGDNRNNSNDSRIWGSVPVSYLKGSVIGIWYSNGHDGISFSRFGDVD